MILINLNTCLWVSRCLPMRTSRVCGECRVPAQRAAVALRSHINHLPRARACPAPCFSAVFFFFFFLLLSFFFFFYFFYFLSHTLSLCFFLSFPLSISFSFFLEFSCGSPLPLSPPFCSQALDVMTMYVRSTGTCRHEITCSSHRLLS